MLDSRFVPSSAGELFGVEIALLQGISYYCALLFLKPIRYVKLIFYLVKKTAKLQNQFVLENMVGTVKVPHPVSFIYYKIIGMQRVSGNMKYPVFRFLWCTDFLWLISSKALPKVFPHVTHWLCFEKA